MSSLFIGLDAGGTKTAALVQGDGPVRRFDGPGAQVLRDGAVATASTLAELIQTARTECGGGDICRIAIGLAGAGRQEDRDAVESALRERLIDVPVHVTHDAEIALEAAFGGESGMTILVGTGSMVYARTYDGDTFRAGGWGALIGDDASGTALGRAAVRAVLASFDGGPPTSMTEIILSETGLATADEIIHAVYSEHRPLASFASVLLAAAESDDWAATSVLTRETNALAQQAGWVATRAAETVAKRLAYSGGLAAESIFRTSLEAALGRHLPGWAIAASTSEPVEAALAMAQRLESVSCGSNP